MNISSNISSIKAHQTMMNTSGNNVANVNSDGYVPRDTMISGAEDSVTANIREGSDSGSKMSQTDLAKELTSQIVAEDTVAVNVSAIKTQDEMLGSLLDIKA